MTSDLVDPAGLLPSAAPATSSGELTVMHIPHAAVSVHLARRRLREDLLLAGVPTDSVDDAEIVLSELLGNAVRHAQAGPSGAVEVRWKVGDGVVEVIVTDGGAATAVTPREPEEFSVSGRGLHIVGAIARSWGVIDRRVARTVWAALVLPRRSAQHV
ncbi:MAG: ATP-binding protein [Kineosporiaceae bacterium]